METAQTLETSTFDNVAIADLGSIATRVVVLPPKKRKDQAESAPPAAPPLDAEPDELLPDASATLVSAAP